MNSAHVLSPLLLCLMLTGCGASTQQQVSAPAAPQPAPPPPSIVSGGTFTMDNAVSGNAVVAFSRGADGTLTRTGSVLTGGRGLGRGLENQGAIAISGSLQVLLAVNPGSDDLSAFHIAGTGPVLASRVASGGPQPISVTENNGLVYVLNSGSPNSVVGLRMDSTGNLTPIANSARALTAPLVSPAQVQFSPDGKLLFVTERATGLIDAYAVGADGTLSAPVTEASAGTGPFGFAFLNDQTLVVSESGTGTASSYSIDPSGRLLVLSGAVQTQQTTACWVALSRNGNFAFVANTASGSISTMSIAGNGKLTLLQSVAVPTDGGPLDLAVSVDGHFLTTVTATGQIDVFSIDQTSGALSKLQTISGLPSGSTGVISQ